MTPRERVLSLLAGKQPDRIPTDYWATPEFDARLKADLDCPDSQTLWRKLDIDAAIGFEPRAIHAHHPDDPEADLWGVRTVPIDYGTGTYMEASSGPLEHATSPSDVHAFRWPSPDDFDYSAVTEAAKKHDQRHWVISGGFEPFLIYCRMRGMEQAYEDLLLHPDIADAIFGHLFEFYYEKNRRTFEAAGDAADFTGIAEDLGGQTGPLIGLDIYRRFMLDNQVKMAELARSHDLRIMYHTDGAAQIFLPDLVDVVGIDVLNPIQWRCEGMDREMLVREYGDRIAFHGAMDNQQTLAFGTVNDVIAEVKQNIEIFADARWICAPCHAIQPVSPTENVIAMYETMREFGKL